MQSSISVNLNIESHSSRTLYSFPCQNLVNEILATSNFPKYKVILKYERDI